jgi:hypothetical protein
MVDGAMASEVKTMLKMKLVPHPFPLFLFVLQYFHVVLLGLSLTH